MGLKLNVHVQWCSRVKTAQGQSQSGLNSEVVLILKGYNSGVQPLAIQ